MRLQAIVIILALLLAACGPSSATPALGAQPTSSAEAHATLGTPVRTTSGAAAIIFQRSGGLAGTSKKWTIYLDGRVVSQQGAEYHVPPEGVSHLLDEIVSLDFFEIQETDRRLDACRDCFVYQISVGSQGQVKTLTFVDGSPETPTELRQVASLIDAFLSSASVR